MQDYTKLNLQENPFKDITPLLDQDESHRLIWAGMPSLRQNLEEIHRQALITNSRQIILNWGTFGVGKTYAAFYFSDQVRLKELAEDYEGNIFHVYIRTPKEGRNAPKQIFRDIMDSFSLSSLNSRIQFVINERGEENLLKFLSRRIKSEAFAKAVLLLGDENPEMTEMMSRYLYSNATKTELKKMGLARSLDLSSDFAKMLTGILLCFLEQKGRVFLWIDEMEDLLFFSAKEYRMISQFLRDAFDQMNEGLTVFMNFTLTEPEQDTVRLLLGDALWSRITENVRFNELSASDGLLYCKELLKQSQIQTDSGEYSPFSEVSLRYLFERIPQSYMTPREINKNCNGILNLALESGESFVSERIISEWFSKREGFD